MIAHVFTGSRIDRCFYGQPGLCAGKPLPRCERQSDLFQTSHVPPAIGVDRSSGPRLKDEIYSERIQAYEAENRKQERALAAQQRQAQQQSGPEFQNQQAPVVRHSGNDWATRKALENAATSAGSITNNGGKWDRAAEAERSRVRQEEARRRAAEEERARAAAAPAKAYCHHPLLWIQLP